MDASASAKVKAVFIALAALATATITLLAVFQVVHWTTSQLALAGTDAGAILALASALSLHLLPRTKREPVALAATFTAAVSATLALGTGFVW
jgi:hypothetical protein